MFSVNENCHVTPGGGGGCPSQCHQMTQGGGGSKIGQKSVTYYLNGPIIIFLWPTRKHISSEDLFKLWIVFLSVSVPICYLSEFQSSILVSSIQTTRIWGSVTSAKVWLHLRSEFEKKPFVKQNGTPLIYINFYIKQVCTTSTKLMDTN